MPCLVPVPPGYEGWVKGHGSLTAAAQVMDKMTKLLWWPEFDGWGHVAGLMLVNYFISSLVTGG